MKRIALFLLICGKFSYCFAQQKTLADSINKLIGPKYFVDIDSLYPFHEYSMLHEVDLNGDLVKEILSVAADTTDENNWSNKIFIFSYKKGTLTIIDTSTAYPTDGRGPKVTVSGKQLLIEHSFHHGSNSLIYTFNALKSKYMLTGLTYSVYTPNAPDMRHGVFVVEKYNINTGKLTTRTRFVNNETDEDDKETTKVTAMKRPVGLSLSLKDMKDPIEYYDIF